MGVGQTIRLCGQTILSLPHFLYFLPGNFRTHRHNRTGAKMNQAEVDAHAQRMSTMDLASLSTMDGSATAAAAAMVMSNGIVS